MSTGKKIIDLQNLCSACEEFVHGWPHFIKCVNFNASCLDAKAIRFFNEVPSKIKQNLEKVKTNEHKTD